MAIAPRTPAPGDVVEPRAIEGEAGEQRRVASAADLAALLVGFRYTYHDEIRLQDALVTVLTDAGFTAHREVRVASRCRIDILVDRVGIEVKVDGTTSDVFTQLQRYARSPLLDELVLATTCARHRGLPESIRGTPLRVAYLKPRLA